MIQTNSIQEHLVESVFQSTLVEEPFPHIRITNCFAEETYEAMLEQLPAESHYQFLMHRDAQRADGTSTRRLFELTKSNLRDLPPEQLEIWAPISQALTSREMQAAIYSKLGDELASRFEISKPEVDKIVSVPKPALCRDVEGYRIAPHCDTMRKIVTLQFYLPEADAQSDLGTMLYERRDDEFICVKTIPFEKNSAYAFVPHKRSWHGRETLRSNDGIRNTLLSIYFDESAGY